MKFSHCIPICYWPCTIYVVDDDLKLHELFKKNFQTDYPMAFFHQAEKAIEQINDFKSRWDWSDYVRDFEEEDEDIETITKLNRDYSKLSEILYSSQRFQLVSTVFMDYKLSSESTGIDFLKQIHNKLVQRVLLTGVGDDKLAVWAFHKKLIDFYLPKQNADFYVFQDTILNMQNNFFTQLTLELINNRESLYQLISHPTFVKIFNELLTNNKIVEFYLLDRQGNFALFNEQGEGMLLSVYTQASLSDLLGYVESLEQSPLVKNVLANLQLGQLPFLGKSVSSAPEVELWNQFYDYTYHQDQTFSFYYRTFDDLSLYDLDTTKIITARKYLSQHQ